MSVELPSWRFGWGVAVIRMSQEVWLEELWISDQKKRLLVELQEADGLLSKVPGKVPSRLSFSLALNSVKTWWNKLVSAAQSCRFLPSLKNSHITSWRLRALFPVEIALSRPSKVPLKEMKLVHTASKCHFIHTAEYLSTMNSVQEFNAPPIRLPSDCTEILAETREHRNSSSGRRHRKKKNNLTMPKETSRKHSIHNTATVSLFYIKKNQNF